MLSNRRRVMAGVALGIPALIGAAGAPTDATSERPAELAGVYRMEIPEASRPSARLRFPRTEVTFLRLLPDGRSRLENVTLVDEGGTIAARVEVGPTNGEPWRVRVPVAAGRPASALAELCLTHAGAAQCQRYERDAETGDVSLYAGATAGSLVLRLERVR